MSSYPAFKVLRGGRHRWLDIGRNRSEAVLGALGALELAGPVEWIHSGDALHRALYEQSPADSHEMDRIGEHAALTTALLVLDRFSHWLCT